MRVGYKVGIQTGVGTMVQNGSLLKLTTYRPKLPFAGTTIASGNITYCNDFKIVGTVYKIEIYALPGSTISIDKVNKYVAGPRIILGSVVIPASGNVVYTLPVPTHISDSELIGCRGFNYYRAGTASTTIGVWESGGNQVGPYKQTQTIELCYNVLAVPDDYISLFKDSAINPNTTTEWVTNGVWNMVSGGVVPQSVGSTYFAQLKKTYHSDNRFMQSTIGLAPTSKVFIACSYGGINTGEGASGFMIDMVNKTLVIYAAGTGLDDQYSSAGYTTTVLNSITIPDNLIGTKDYLIELRKQGTHHNLRLLDPVTGINIEVHHDGWGAGRQNERYGFYAVSGNFNLKTVEVFSLNRPDVVFAGDSITEGVYVYDRTHRYAEYFRQNRPTKKVVISARGADDIDGILAKFATEYNIYRPKVLSVLIGANGGNTLAKFQTLKANCDAIGCTLMLNYRTCQTGDAHLADNDLIAQISTSHARFDIITAKDGVPTVDATHVTPRYDPAMFADSGLHPNEAANLLMYNRFIADIGI